MDVVGQTSFYYIYGHYADQKAVILNDFDHAHIGLLTLTSSLNKYFVVVNKEMQKSPNFNWKEFYVEFPDLAQELRRQETLNKNLQSIMS